MIRYGNAQGIDGNHGDEQGAGNIPKTVRDRLGIEPGNAVDFQLAPDGWVILV